MCYWFKIHKKILNFSKMKHLFFIVMHIHLHFKHLVQSNCSVKDQHLYTSALIFCIPCQFSFLSSIVWYKIKFENSHDLRLVSFPCPVCVIVLALVWTMPDLPSSVSNRKKFLPAEKEHLVCGERQDVNAFCWIISLDKDLSKVKEIDFGAFFWYQESSPESNHNFHDFFRG